MHPTQHSTIPRIEPRIMRTHRLITQGVSHETGDTVVKAAVESLQSLTRKPSAKALHIAPERRGLHEMLKQASETAKSFTPRRPNFNMEAA